jgi:hypothetical protein
VGSLPLHEQEEIDQEVGLFEETSQVINLAQSFEEQLWQNRPFFLGGEIYFPDTRKELESILWWNIVLVGAGSAWHAATNGRGVGVNMLLGELIYPQPRVSVGRHWHSSGGSPGFIQETFRRTPGKKQLFGRSVALLAHASPVADAYLIYDYAQEVITDPAFVEPGGPVVASNQFGIPMPLWIWMFG